MKVKLFLLAFITSIELVSQTPLPYINNFDNISTDTIGWSHYATSGIDDWQLGTPNGSLPFSPPGMSYPNAWVTNLDGDCSINSTRFLETPFFDISNLTVHNILSFKHVREAGTGSNMLVEYSEDGNNWMFLDDIAAQKKNWHDNPWGTGFFLGSSSLTYKESAMDISFLTGIDSVKFRFKFESSSSTGKGGWLIDDFRISKPYYNLRPERGDTIYGINQHFSEFTAQTPYSVINQWGMTSLSIQRDFYFSEDEELDSFDIYLGSLSTYTSSSFVNSNSSQTYPLPSGLHSGTYYLLQSIDSIDTVDEFFEDDNINFTVLVLDSIYASNYVEDFDSSEFLWNKHPGPYPSNWTRGNPNNWHLESNRSGINSVFSGDFSSSGGNLISPFLDLTGTSNNVICFWYRSATVNNEDPDLRFYLPTYGNAQISQPFFSNQFDIPNPRVYGWDCYCKDMSDYDGEISTKVKFRAFGNLNPTSLNQSQIDDLYIGEAKPDASIEGHKINRYTSSGVVLDTFHYDFFNGGLSPLPTTTTNFYWSNDSILDVSDVFLGNQSEPSMTDTSFIRRTFTYSKPTSVEGRYFIIYEADGNDEVNEMREYDNLGYVEVFQTVQKSLPYFNDFDTETSGWRSSSTLGLDNWQHIVPPNQYSNEPFIGQKSFYVSSVSDTVPSRMHLYSPIFNLTELNKPVLEFDMIFSTNSAGWGENMGNIMYSVDGGATWNELKAESNSYKELHTVISYQSIQGTENTVFEGYSEGFFLYGNNFRRFPMTYGYQGRNYDEAYHNVVDLSFLSQFDDVQFMFVFATFEDHPNGMLVDNFSIREGEIDLAINDEKKILASSSDKFLKLFFHVKNVNNYISDSTNLILHLSQDTILDSEDLWLVTRQLDRILPYEKRIVNITKSLPGTLEGYNYVLYEIDEEQSNVEVNELNNIGYFDLAIDSCTNYEFPVEFNFDQDQIDGWTWYHDGTGLYLGHQFRHQELDYGDVGNYAEDGVWFLDGIDLVGFGVSPYNYPKHYLESPAYDFSAMSSLTLNFDFSCRGYNIDEQGANLQFSTDGGLTWEVLSTEQDQYAQNWYDKNTIHTLGNQPGWAWFQSWTPAQFDLTFLAGQSNVRFRFQVRTKFGFRMDNFNISGFNVDLAVNQESLNAVYADINVPYFQASYEVENVGDVSVYNSETHFYWSNDTVLDNSDILLYEVPEPNIDFGEVYETTRSFYYPSPVLQDTMYLLYSADANDLTHESIEENNFGYIMVIFNEISQVDLFIIPSETSISVDSNNNFFYFEFDHWNEGNSPSSPSELTVYWSSDQNIDLDDDVLYTLSEPSINSNSSNPHSGNVYYPHPILQSAYYLIFETDTDQENIETNENNNVTVVEVVFDTNGLNLDHLELNKISLLNFPNTLKVQNISSNHVELIQILDPEGRIIKSESIFPISESIEINKPHLSTGVYFLKIHFEQKQKTFKFFHYEN